MSKKNGTTKSVVVIITLITVLCKVFGFIKNSFLAYYYGTSHIVDAYVMTFSIGTITCGWIAGLIGNFTPIFKDVEHRNGRLKALIFSSNVHNFVFVLVLVLVLALEFIAPIVVNIVAPGFQGETFDYTVYFFRVYLISVLFYATYRFSQEFLNCNQKHLAAIVPDLIMSVICIVAIIVSKTYTDSLLIYGYVIAVILQCVCVQVSCYKYGFRHRLMLNWDDNLKSLIMMAIPIFMSNALAEINILIDKMFASQLQPGVVASLEYANNMKDCVYQVGTIAILTMIFPVLAKYWSENNIDGFKKSVMRGVDLVTVLYLPMITGIIIVGDYVIDIVYKRGQFSGDAAIITTNAFIIYSIGLIALVIRSIFLKAFYSMKKTKYILTVCVMNVISNVILNIILVNQFGYIGLTIATTASALLCLPLYFVFFKLSIKKIRFKNYFLNTVKVIITCIVMYLSTIYLKKILFVGNDSSILYKIFFLIVLVLFAVIIYLAIGDMMKINEIHALVLRGKKTLVRRHDNMG